MNEGTATKVIAIHLSHSQLLTIHREMAERRQSISVPISRILQNLSRRIAPFVKSC